MLVSNPLYNCFSSLALVTILENGRYGHAKIRSDTSIRVYATADTRYRHKHSLRQCPRHLYHYTRQVV